jgi:hypothetical protein
MKISQLSCVICVTAVILIAATWRIAGVQSIAAPPATIFAARFVGQPVNITVIAKANTMPPNALVEAAFRALGPNALASLDATDPLPKGRVLASIEDDHWQEARPTAAAGSVAAARHALPYLKYYVYSELPPPEKPAKIALEAFSDIPLGTPLEEIKRAAGAFGLDYNFMKAVAKVESDFDPKQRTGSYIGLFQLSKAEFAQYGSGNITNPRDNAMAAAYKFVTEAAIFEDATRKTPTSSDLYLIHQQGWEGAVEHVNHPNRIAWKSMCATDEGMNRGERWCKQAIWGNTLPQVKREWRSVDRLTSGAFVAMWREQIETLRARYADVERAN